MDEAKGIKTVGNDEALKAVPLSQRQHWLTPAMIFGGLEFTIPVLMIGATLTASYGMGSIFWILVIGLIVFQWVGNSIQGFIGAKTGRSSSVIAKSSFGSVLGTSTIYRWPYNIYRFLRMVGITNCCCW